MSLYLVSICISLSLIRQYKMPTRIAVVWLYRVLEMEELSPPNVNKSYLIHIYKTVCKVKLADVIRTVDWFLLFIPFAPFPVHSSEVGELLREAKALCNDTSARGPAHV